MEGVVCLRIESRFFFFGDFSKRDFGLEEKVLRDSEVFCCGFFLSFEFFFLRRGLRLRSFEGGVRCFYFMIFDLKSIVKGFKIFKGFVWVD